MRVLFTSTPGRGHLGPLVPVAVALRDAGHEVSWATAPSGCSTVAALGFKVDPAGLDVPDRRAALVDRLPQIMALPPRERRGHLFAGFFVQAAGPAMLDDLRPLVDAVQPDMVVHEAAELGIAPLASERSIPRVVVAFSGPPSRQARPTVSAALTAWWASLGLEVPPHGGLAGDRYLHPFPERLGAEPPWAFERLRPHSSAADAPAEPPGWLGALGADRPAVYVTFGTEPTAADAPWGSLVEALGDRDIDALLTTGAHGDLGALGPLPANVRVERFVPQALVLERVAAVVSHAGAGTMLGAAGAGVPQLVLPIFADQWDNADAIVSAGAAILCEEGERSADGLGTALDRLLADGAARVAAGAIADELRTMPTAVDHVLGLEALAQG